MRLAILNPLTAWHANRPHFDTGPQSIAAVRILRISITDRCNFRCVYCMPASGVAWLPREKILRFEEIADVVRAAIDIHGIRRFKLTGGEPTLRHGLVDLVGMLKKIAGVEDLSLTTNGLLLATLAEPLKQAGLDRVTVSLDSLRPERFRLITRTGDLATVLRGIDALEVAGFASTKINCVTMRGANDDELVDFARLSIDRSLTVRFIEYMPLGDAALMHESEPGTQIAAGEIGPAAGCGAQDRGEGAFISGAEMRERIERVFGQLIPVDRTRESGVGPAEVFQLPGTPLGRIGFISAMSAPFCSTCNRLRLTADGVLRSCLFDGGEVPIRDVIRNLDHPTERPTAIAEAMVRCVRQKPHVHSAHGNQQMSRIGG